MRLRFFFYGGGFDFDFVGPKGNKSLVLWRPLASFGGAVQTPRSDSPAGEAGGSWRALPTLLPYLFLPKPPPSNSECFESFLFLYHVNRFKSPRLTCKVPALTSPPPRHTYKDPLPSLPYFCLFSSLLRFLSLSLSAVREGGTGGFKNEVLFFLETERGTR